MSRIPGISKNRLNIENTTALLSYLRCTGRIEAAEMPTMSILSGGVSNRTVRVDRSTGECWVMKQALSRLRVSVGWYSSPKRPSCEALGAQWLARFAPGNCIPKVIFDDLAHNLFAMQAAPKHAQNWKKQLLNGIVENETFDRCGHLLGQIHANSATDRSAVERVFAERRIFESLRLEPYYGYTAGQIAPSAEFFSRLLRDTRRIRSALVHGDFSAKNILISNKDVILLDHEVMHFGDPAFDVGFALAHFLSKANPHVTTSS